MKRDQANEKPQPAHFVGVWLDQRKAKIVELKGDEATCSEITSEVERRTHATGGTKMPGKTFVKSQSASERQRDMRRSEQLARFYKSIVRKIHDADRIAIMGPGRTKLDFAKVAREDKQLADRLMQVEALEAVTDRQLAAHVKQLFQV